MSRSLVVALIAASLFGGGIASADPSSTVSGGVDIRGGNKVDAPQSVTPRGACRYWKKSHSDTNGQAQQDFHTGLSTMITKCGG